jgi:hypothetical protein
LRFAAIIRLCSQAALTAVSLAVLLTPAASAAPALQIVNPGVRQIEDGPLAHDIQFVPGETVYYSFQATGYATTPGEADSRKVMLNYQIDVFDPKGVKLVETTKSVLDTVISDQDKEWKPKVRFDFLIPTFAPPGKYKITATLTDAISKLSATTETSFEASGRTVEPSTELTVRNFGFFRADEDQKPLATAAYRAGDNVFAHFDITGFRYGDRNSIEVSYDVAVQNPDGKVIYSQPNAAVEKSYSFYPKPFVPGGMSLSLQANMRKGEYSVVLTVHDVIGHQNYELKQAFQVE